MRTMISELLDTGRKMVKLYNYEAISDPREKECFEYVELGRQRTNLKRTVLFSLLLVLAIITYMVVTVVRGESDIKTRVMLVVIVAVLLLFVLIVGRFYRTLVENFSVHRNRRIASALYIIFWDLYYVMMALCVKLFLNMSQSVLLLIAMLFTSMSLAMLNKKEFFLVAPVGVTCIGVYIYFMQLDVITNMIWAPILLILLVVTQTNHMQRLETFYDCAANQVESAEMKRRLAKVFEEVFDLAFEFDIQEGNCYILRSNESYDITSKTRLGVEEFSTAFRDITYPDDMAVIERNLNFAYLSNEFMVEKQQIYFEIRIKNTNLDYRWVSVFITKESDTLSSDYLLCLIQDIEERKKNEDKLRLEAEKDPLTQLYNKTTVKSLIEETFEKASSGQHALIIIDIDNFKIINDTRGHVVGDQILLAFAAELNKNFRETDILGRAGGDEFIVLLKNVQSVAMVCDKLQRLSSSFKKYGIDHGFPGRLSMSIGVAMFNKDGKVYEELFKKADAALYEAKRNGKDQYKFSISRSE